MYQIHTKIVPKKNRPNEKYPPNTALEIFRIFVLPHYYENNELKKPIDITMFVTRPTLFCAAEGGENFYWFESKRKNY